MFKNVGWKDVLLHVLGALILTYLISFVFNWFAPIINALFWSIREIVQDYNKGHKWPFIWPFRWSTQKFWEALAPAAAGFLISFFL